MEDDLFHIQGAALIGEGSGHVVSTKGELHQLHQGSDMVQFKRFKSKLMQTGSDNPVIQRVTKMAWLTVNVGLKKKEERDYYNKMFCISNIDIDVSALCAYAHFHREAKGNYLRLN